MQEERKKIKIHSNKRCEKVTMISEEKISKRTGRREGGKTNSGGRRELIEVKGINEGNEGARKRGGRG